MQRLATAQFAIPISISVHMLLVGLMVWQRAAVLQRMEFAGESKAVTIAATFAPPVPLSEPQPVNIVTSEMDATETTVEVAAEALVARQSLDLKPTRKEAEIVVAELQQTPQARLANRRQFQRQPDPPKPSTQPVPRQSRPIKVASLASAVPIPVGNVKKTPPDFSMNPPPDYPAEAKRNGWKGEVLLRLTIALDGRVSEAIVAKSSGYTILDDAAVEAVRRWKGLPATVGGQPVAVVRYLPVRFSR
ncbi:energy transducer TonB [Bremerella sp. JC817]|uniref:energy transducer TonB n=1 Tax=Bremerella sp. JC817 TaxID=3231756 RepID=UPI003458B8DE